MPPRSGEGALWTRVPLFLNLEMMGLRAYRLILVNKVMRQKWSDYIPMRQMRKILSIFFLSSLYKREVWRNVRICSEAKVSRRIET
jgi:hypothetical protein